MRKKISVEILFIVFIILLLSFPFIKQAYHIDDWVYLTGAKRSLEKGIDAFDGKIGYLGKEANYYEVTHPPFFPWLLSLPLRIYGTKNEIPFHSFSIFFFIVAGISGYLISSRFTTSPLLSTLFFFCFPSILVMSHNLMADMPTLAFFLLAVSFHIYGVNRNSIPLLIIAGVTATFAWLISYHSLFLLFLFPAYNIIYEKKRGRNFIPIFISSVLFISWWIFTDIKYGIPHPVVALRWFGDMGNRCIYNFFPKLAANLNVIGATTIFPIFLLWIYWKRTSLRKWVIFSVFTTFLLVLGLTKGYSFFHKILFLIFFSTGLSIFLRMIQNFLEGIKEREKSKVFLSLWFLSYFILCIFIMPLAIARYLLPCFTPMAILFANDLKIIYPRQFDRTIILGLSLTLLIGTFVSLADYQYAGVYREFVNSLSQRYKGKNIWFTGEWGFRWYMEDKGYKYLLPEDKLPPEGDIVVIPKIPCPIYSSELERNLKIIESINYKGIVPIRTMNFEAHAGFYSEWGGKLLLPYSISNAPIEHFVIYEVRR